MSTQKLTAVQKALENPYLEQWYRKQSNTTANDFTVQNVREYGLGGKGDLADQIISDAVDDGLLPAAALDL